MNLKMESIKQAILTSKNLEEAIHLIRILKPEEVTWEDFASLYKSTISSEMTNLKLSDNEQVEKMHYLHERIFASLDDLCRRCADT